MQTGFICPVCAYHDPAAAPYNDAQDSWYQEICPCCGTQFAYDDATRSHEELRAEWIAGGAKWHSSREKPENFDGLQQVRDAKLID